MHVGNREGLNRPRTQGRGFTLLEFAVALAVFALIAGVVTLAVARAQLASAGTRLDRAVRAEMSSLLELAATNTYASLAQNTFTRPSPCTQDALESCVEALGRTFTVEWVVSAGSDLAGTSTTNPGAVTLTTQATLPGGRSVTASRTVVSPNGGRDDTTGLVRVRLSGATFAGPVYLVDATDEVVGSGVASGGVAMLRAPAASCTRAAPCRVALGPTGETSTSDASLDAAAAVGAAADVVVSTDTTTDVGVALLPVSSVELQLLAANPDGVRARPTTLGSVCLYLTFFNGVESVSVPGCNTDAASVISFSTYAPDPAFPDRLVALPQGTNLRLTTDHPNGTCPSIPGQLGWNGSSWNAAAVCTSWTWGPATTAQIGVNPALTGVALPVDLLAPSSGAREYQVVWSGLNARPATGFSGQTPWQFPQVVPACAASASCTSSTPPATFATVRAGSQVAPPPELVLPRASGAWAFPAAPFTPGSRSTFTVQVSDFDQSASASDRISATVLDAPTGLELVTYPGGVATYTPVTSGSSILLNQVSPASTTLAYTGQVSGPARVDVTLSLSDGASSRDVTLHLYSSTAPAEASPAAGEVRQGTSRIFPVPLFSQGGAAATSASGISASAPAGILVGALTVSPDGVLNVPITVTSASAGAAVVTLTMASGEQVSLPLLVKQSATTVTVSADDVSQGDDVPVSVTVRDAAGNLMTGTDVAFAVSDSLGGTALGVYALPSGCRTNASGVCSVSVVAEPAAASGNYSIVASAQGVSSTAAGFSVLRSTARLVGTGVAVTQGTSGTASVRAVDGQGEPVSGVSVSVGPRPAGVSVGVAGTSDAAGVVVLNVTVARSTPVDVYPVTVTVGNVETKVRIEVVPVISSVRVNSSVTVPQGGNSNLAISVQDPTGAPVAGAVLTVSASGPVRAPASVVTNANGVAQVNLQSPSNAIRGTYPLLVTTSAGVNASSDVFVGQGVASVTVLGDLARGGGTNVAFLLRDYQGQIVTNRMVTVTSRSKLITPVTQSATSDGRGRATVTLTTSSSASAGVVLFDLGVDGRVITVGVVVSS